LVLVRQFIPVEAGTSFHRYSAPLVPGDWELCSVFDDPPCGIASPDQFAALLTDVDRIVLVTDIIDGSGEVYHLDNFSFTEPPVAPTPPTPPATPPAVTPANTGQRAAALKRCKKKTAVKRRKCRRKANRLPV
jgi:hypothetical protein